MANEKEAQNAPIGPMNVQIKGSDSGTAEIFMEGRRVPCVISYSVEQNAYDKRVPILNLRVLCNLDLDCGAIPVLPEPWSWFYVPKASNFVDVRDIIPPSESPLGE